MCGSEKPPSCFIHYVLPPIERNIIFMSNFLSAGKTDAMITFDIIAINYVLRISNIILGIYTNRIYVK